MKRFVTAFAIAALLMATTASQAALVKWDNGVGNRLWNSGNNWAPNGVPSSGNGILLDYTHVSSNWPILDVNPTNASLTMRRGSLPSSPVSIDLAGYTLTITGTVTIDDTGGSSYAELLNSTGSGVLAANAVTITSTSADAHFYYKQGSLTCANALTMTAPAGSNAEAIFHVGQSFAPNSVSLMAGPTTDRECVLDIDAAFTVASANGSPDSFMSGYINCDVGSDIVADFKDLQFDADGQLYLVVSAGGGATADFKTNEFRVQEADNVQIAVTKAGSGLVNADSFVIQGSAGQPATFTVSAGTLQTR